MVLRELITRFSFETDKKSVKKYNTVIGSMKKSAIGLGAILGLSIGGKALFGMGVSAKQAQADLKRLSGVKFNDLNNELDALSERLDSVQAGASNILRKKTFNVLASNFIKEFGATNDEIKIFTKLLETSTLQAAVTGQSIEEIFTSLTAARKAGDFSGLLGVGGFDLAQQRILEDIVAAKNPQEIGGQFGRQINTEALLNAIESIRAEQVRQVKEVDPELLSLQIASKFLKDKTEKAAEEGVAASVRAAASTAKESDRFFDELSKRKESGEDIKFTGLLTEKFNKVFSSAVKKIKAQRETEEEEKAEPNKKVDEQAQTAVLPEEQNFIARWFRNQQKLEQERRRAIGFGAGARPVETEKEVLLNEVSTVTNNIKTSEKIEEKDTIERIINQPVIKEGDTDTENFILNFLREQQEIDRKIKEEPSDLLNNNVIDDKKSDVSEKNIEITLNTNIHVTEATDAPAIVELIKREDSKRISEAKRQLIKSEDKF